jgi:hypothetical protein
MSIQPLPRHPALIPISQRHHKVLLCAQIIRSDVPAYKHYSKEQSFIEPYLNEQWENLIAPLLQWEQLQLFTMPNTQASLWEGLSELQAPLITAYAACKQSFSPRNADEVAHRLIAWVRYKERQLFPWIQQNWTVDDLEKLQASFTKNET